MSRWPSAVVWVMKQETCGVSMCLVRKEKGTGCSSPFCSSRRSQAMVRPSSRAGVPVLSRPSFRPASASCSEKPRLGGSPWRPAGMRRSPIWMRPLRKVPVVRTTAAHAESSGHPRRQRPSTQPFVDQQGRGRARDDGQIGLGCDRSLHGLPIELAVCLGAGTAHGRALGAVEQAELDAGLIGHPAHQPVQRIDLAHQMAFAKPADGRIAGHFADRVGAMGQQGGAGAQAGCSGRCLRPGMAAADRR